MIRYSNYLVTLTEVPDEVSLCFNIANCPCKCKGCFEPWLQEDKGYFLDFEVIKILKSYYISCICFMGGDGNVDELRDLLTQCRKTWPNIKLAMYSGKPYMNEKLAPLLDYYKVGPYMSEYGPLNNPETNQRFYKKEDSEWIDITHRFYDKTV